MTPIQIIQKRQKLQENPIAWPLRKYSTVVIDPPWPMKKIEREVAPNQIGFDYPTMNLRQIKDLSVPDILHDNAFVFLWTTQRFLPWAFEILSHWDLKYRGTMVWHKPGGFQPFKTFQYNLEFIVVSAKGTPEYLDQKSFMGCFNAPRGKHSEKPETFYELIERVAPGPRVDLFARKERRGFVAWGNEVKKLNYHQPLLPYLYG